MRVRRLSAGDPDLGTAPTGVEVGEAASPLSANGSSSGDRIVMAVRGVHKTFGRVIANDDLHLEVRPGRIHGLLGENGAGKSTIIKILGGIYRQDSGQIEIDGHAVSIDSPYQASMFGIEIVHQESILIPSLSIAENIALRRKVRGRLSAEISTGFIKTANELGFVLNPNSKVEELSIGDRQRTDIVIALLGNASVIILDDPTPIMGPDERATFFTMLRRLADQGKAIIIVTHRLREAVDECDDITVLRAGRAVASWASRDFPTENGILEAMIGTRDLVRGNESKKAVSEFTGAPTLSVRELTAKCSERLTVRADQLDVRPGEILGIGGIEGSGQRELATLLVGQRRPDSGTVQLLGRRVSDFTERELCSTVGDVPDEPSLAAAGELNIWENLALPQLLWDATVGPKKRRQLKAAAAESIQLFNIKAPHSMTQLANLSGGNKRRVVLARETYVKAPALIVLTYATRGLDARAAGHLLAHIQSLANAGTAVVFISSDLDELLTICDNVAVIVDGIVARPTPAAELGQADIAAAMLGLLDLHTRGMSGTNSEIRIGLH